MNTVNVTPGVEASRELSDTELSMAAGGNIAAILGAYILGKVLDKASEGPGVPTQVAKAFMNAIGKPIQ